MMSNLKIFLLFFLILVQSSARANDLASIRQEIALFAENFVLSHIPVEPEDKVKVRSHKIDERIDVSTCDIPLTGKMPATIHSRNMVVQVLCESESSPWKMFIPVRITHLIPVVIAAKNLDKGSVIDSSSIEVSYRNKANITRETFEDLNQFLQAKASRRISAGQPITRQNICFVCQGETVTIAAMSENFNIKTTATALSDGAIGEVIRARNKRSGRIVEARVVSVNSLVIEL